MQEKKRFNATALIAATGTTSAAVTLGEKIITGIILPVTTGTSFTLTVSVDGTNFFPLNSTGNIARTITKTAATATAYSFDEDWFSGWSYVKIVSGSAEAAARSIIFSGYEV